MIPARNLYYMLLYAWGHFRASDVRSVGEDDSPNLPNLLAQVLVESTHRLLRQGLDRGYLEIHEETRSLRGRLRLEEMVKRQTLLRGLAVCEFDELTPDVLHNRILLETLIRLAGNERVERGLRHELMLTVRRMGGVSRVRLTSDLFKRVQLSRNTSQYRLLMHICELLFHELMPDTAGGTKRFQGIADDQVRMAALFEEFLRKFYDLELIAGRARAEIMPWDATSSAPSDLTYLPVMKTDITIRLPGRVLVVDAKYYPSHLTKSQFGGERLMSNHLYQLNTYLAHVAAREPERKVSGMLLYPQNSEPVELNYKLLGRQVKVASVDLAAEWPDIHQRLITLAE
jgi:5-methylcytosine-specific restriction enzyme subunit McrC